MPKLENGRNKLRKNISISPELYADAELLMSLDHYDDFSEFMSSLVREHKTRKWNLIPDNVKLQKPKKKNDKLNHR